MPTAKPMAVSRTAAARMMVVEISTVVFSSPPVRSVVEITKQPGTLFTISGERVAEPRWCEEGAELVLQPERAATYADKVKKSNRDYSTDDRGPYFQRKPKHFHIQEKGQRVSEQHDGNNKLPVSVPHTEAHYREIDL